MDATASASVAKLKAKLQIRANEIRTIVEQGRLISTDITQLFLFKGMYKELKPYYEAFLETWDDIADIYTTYKQQLEFPKEDDENLHTRVKRDYFEALAIYEHYMNPTPTVPPIAATAPSQSNISALNESRTVRARLPQINLPDFTGIQTEWPLFRDTYRSLIHEEATLSDMEKFLFLVSCLKGQALTLIKGIELQEANYEQAWKLLNDTYNDKRRLASSYLNIILGFSPFKSRPTAANLKHLLTTVGESVDSLKQLNIPSPEDFILFSLMLRCLDTDTRRSFEKLHSKKEFPTYKDLTDFLRVEWRSLELTTPDTTRPPNPKADSSHNGNPRSFNKSNKSQASLLVDNRSDSTVIDPKRLASNNSIKAPRAQCPVCKSQHNLYHCARFRKAPATEKCTLLKGWAGCINCLSSRHSVEKCTSHRKCQTCSKRHHNWLHVQSLPEQPTQVAPTSSPSTSGIALGSIDSQGEVLLGTAIIEILDINNVYRKIRAVTDSGSQHSFITEDCAKMLGLPIDTCFQVVSGIGQVPLTSMSGKTQCTIRSPIANAVPTDLNTEAIVVKRITGNLPHTALPEATKELYKSYVLADSEFWQPAPVQFLLGGNLFYDILTGRPIKVIPTAPRLLPSIFGYIIGGPTGNLGTPNETTSLLTHSNEEIKQVINKFWEIEEVSRKPIISQEDQITESHFTSTHYRLPSGRYVVSLPLKDSISTLTNPRHQAMSRFLNLENKLAKNATLKNEYHLFMKEYISLGHMRLVTPGSSLYTIPHHAVVKENNGNIKLRVVFDASCSAGSSSLNDHMYAGPKLQLDISDVITNFRLHTLVLTADIVKMYRQVVIKEADRKYQHILWRFSPTESVSEYELCTVTYGEKASAFLAQRTIQQLVQDDGTQYPLASVALLNDIYVDDIATGADSTASLLKLKDQLIALLAKGGFQLSKWASNCPALLDSITEVDRSSTCVTLTDEEEPRIKVLGIHWNPKEDVFSYEICTPPWKPTKRAILSTIARIYDPLGFLAPVTFYAKTLLQEMWMSKVGWDEIGPTYTTERWRILLAQLSMLSEIKLQRCISPAGTNQHQLIGFCDASQKGYAAVLYLRSLHPGGSHTSLIKAKTKLAPIKPMTIPRLELAGALLLCRIFQSCRSLMSKLKISKVAFFTDSQVVLGWLATPPERLSVFVAHRVVEILEHTKGEDWNFIPSEDNPADCSSRGVLPSELIHHPLWWEGPLWLSSTNASWPATKPNVPEDLPELKRKPITTLTAHSEPDPTKWMERFSSYPNMVRCAAYLLRLISWHRNAPKTTDPITAVEFKQAASSLLRMTQNCYKKPNGQLADVKSLRTLRPFVDEEGFVRVGGRLQNSELHHDVKHPLLIPSRHHFTRLLVDYHHRAYLHLGPTALQAMLQRKYWIIGARALIRRRVFQCLTCYKAMTSPQVPVMGNLPSYRLEEGQVFIHVGVDMAGPFSIRESLRRKAALGKAYLALFVCMSTKAVHLEVVSKCSTDAFLAAFSRFVARRGKPANMYSDCGTNFVGAANRMKAFTLLMRNKEAQNEIIEQTASQEINWSFNPPSSPHFGGIWEAGVKSTKSILYKVMGDTPLTFEELATLFCTIESILNSRPLVPVGSDPETNECLTPGHFLIGRPLTATPVDQPPSDVTPLQRWKLIQLKAHHFWTRWRLEYLNHLQQRKKWTKSVKNINQGDLVIIKEPNAPLKSWPLARVVQTHAGQDGIVRVATIRTASGIYKRPVAKLVSLMPVVGSSIS